MTERKIKIAGFVVLGSCAAIVVMLLLNPGYAIPGVWTAGVVVGRMFVATMFAGLFFIVFTILREL